MANRNPTDPNLLGPRTPTDPSLRSPAILLETLQASSKAMATKVEGMDAHYEKIIALMDERIRTLELANNSLIRSNDIFRNELREMRMEFRDFKLGRSRING